MPQHDELQLWLLLDELPLPSNPAAEPLDCTVEALVVNRSSPERCSEAGLRGTQVVGKPGSGNFFVPLPVIHVLTHTGIRPYRLPLDLGQWTWNADLDAKGGRLALPARVRFGFADGRPTATFVTDPSRLPH